MEYPADIQGWPGGHTCFLEQLHRLVVFVSNRPLSDGDVQLILKLPPSIGIGEPGVCRQVQPRDQPASAGTWLACFESTRIYDSYGAVQRK